MKKLLIFILFLPMQLWASDPFYTASSIPDSLMGEGVEAVVRVYESSFEVNSLKESVLKVKYVITIMNKNALHEALIRVPYNTKLSKVAELDAWLLHADGSKLASYKRTDAMDVAQFDGVSIYSDNRMKVIDLRSKITQFPCTVYYEYAIEDKQTLSYPVWTPYQGEHISVERASFSITVPTEVTLNIKEVNISKPASKVVVGDKTTYGWHEEALKGFTKEPLSPSAKDMFPFVYLTPSKFSFSGYEGSFDSWKAFGQWSVSLKEGRNDLPAETIAQVQRLVADAASEEEKVRRIYKFMQSNTRYVSIQLGIGGMQPFAASFVQKNGFGDCKALSNYTQALLEAVGIQSHYALIKAGANEADIMTDFPSNQFDHVILCVPMQQDSIWLECTSQTNPFGYLGGFTENRHALLIKADASGLARTPRYTENDNRQVNKITAALDKEGNITASIEELFIGVSQDALESQLTSTSNDFNEWLYRYFDFPSVELYNYSIKQYEGQAPKYLPSIALKTEASIRKYASVSGKRLFIQPNLVSKSNYSPKPVEARTSPFILKGAYTDTDTVVLKVPENFHVEFLPETIQVNEAFGSFSASFSQNDAGDIVYTRSLIMKAGTYAPDLYKNYVEFWKKIVKSDKTKLVLVDKT